MAWLALAAALFCGAWNAPASADGVPASLLRQIRSTRLEPRDAVSLSNLQLDLGHARLDVDRGVLFPASTDGGRKVELVFIGQARVRIVPPDNIEAEQLELFTGRRSLDAAVDQAVLVLADPTTVDRLLDRPTADPRIDLVERAREIHQQWLLKTERRTTGVESSIFRFLVGDAAYQDYFALWCRSHEVGDFVYQLDPEEEEQITLASFTPADVQGWDRLRMQRHIRIQQRKGRWLGVRIEDVGAWDVWLSTKWGPTELGGVPGNAGFESEHYDIDLKIKRDRMMLDGRAKLRLNSQVGGRTTLSLDLFRDLKVTRVTDEAGRELFSFRSGNEVVVRLAEPTQAGRSFTIEVEYEGRILAWVGRKTFDLNDTSTWYPHVGTVDRATYDVRFAWPKKYDLIASGRLIEEGREKHYRWARRRLDKPTTAFSFVLGYFDVSHARIGHVDLTMAFPERAPARLTPAVRDAAIDTVGRALRFFEERFGPYPMDELTVVTLPRRFSQSYLGFITLTDSILLGEDAFQRRNVELVRETLIAHELAHQWWGNLVGWWSYRDQWLSEAMANYASLLFYAGKEGVGDNFLAEMSAGWRDMLSQRTAGGHTLESLGPVVLGGRLNSSLSERAYQAIVYRKGAVVLAMLARTVGEERFLEMLRTLVERASDRVLTTDTFLSSIERMSGIDLDGFAQRFVYGTGIPRVYYDYAAAEDGEGNWSVSGEARLLAEPTWTFEVTRRANGQWDLLRRPVFGDRSTAMMVPFRVTLDDEGTARTPTGRLARTDWGRLMIEGEHQPFRFETDAPPVELDLDPRGEILARFYPVDRFPKRGKRFRGHDLALEGKLEEAERMYLGALDVEVARVAPDSENAWTRSPEAEGVIEDSRIRLSLARLYLGQRRLEAAQGMLQAVEQALESDTRMFRMERDALWARLELATGDPSGAFERLKKTMRLAAPRGGPRNWQALLWQVQLNSERLAVTEGFALLAIAAHEVGEGDEFAWAVDRARDRGTDVSRIERAGAN